MATKLVVGCGYLGKRVALRWRDEGHTVYATTRSAARAEEWLALGFQPLICDISDPQSLQSLPQVDTALHCVGFDRTAGKTMRAVYVQGLRNVRAALPQPGRFLHVSSVSVYGQTDGGEVDENSPTNPVEESGQVVLDAEGEVAGATILRFAGIYGPERLLRAQSLLAGQPVPGDPDRWLNLIQVDDGVRAVLAAENVLPGVYNIADGHPVRRRDFFTFLAELIGAPVPRFEPTPEVVNRRINNRRMVEELKVTPLYPDYQSGLRASKGA